MFKTLKKAVSVVLIGSFLLGIQGPAASRAFAQSLQAGTAGSQAQVVLPVAGIGAQNALPTLSSEIPLLEKPVGPLTLPDLPQTAQPLKTTEETALPIRAPETDRTQASHRAVVAVDQHRSLVPASQENGTAENVPKTSPLSSVKTLARGLDNPAGKNPAAADSMLSSFYDQDPSSKNPSEEAVGVSPAVEPARSGLSQPKDVPADETSANAFVPAPLASIAAKARRVMLGTSFFKIGMETFILVGQLIAVQHFGGAVWVAAMAMIATGSIAVGSGISGGLLDRNPANKVVAFAMAGQALMVSAIIAVLLGGFASPATILPLHALGCAMFGIVRAGNDCIPARLIGSKQHPLEKFNSKKHILYEVAGTLAPLLCGLLLHRFGLAAALCLHPPALLIGAIFFYGLDIPAAETSAKAASSGITKTFRQFFSDLKTGAKVIFDTKDLRMIAVVNSGSIIMNRVLKSIVLPLFAKSVLGDIGKMAWMSSALNFGQLIGAMFLLKTFVGAAESSDPSPYRWLPWLALGTLLIWGFSASANIYTVLPIVSFLSLVWAGNYLSMQSSMQSRLPNESAGKALGFMRTLETGLVMAALYLFGKIFDVLSPAWAFSAVGILATITAATYLFAAWKLRKQPNP
ncbi:MAG: hypothetical protein WCU88_01855 [Elusimicrobiota bacterium]|jgi:hypothetical protein